MYVDIFNTDQRYELIVADPPWKQAKGGKKSVRENSSGRPLDYPVCSLEEIKEHLKAADALTSDNDEYNEKALNAFSYFAKTAMNDYALEDVDPEELIDHYIRAEVVHTTQPNRNNPEKNITFANLGDKAPADGFDTEPVSRALTIGRGTGNNTKAAPKATAPKQTATAPKKGLDLDALLG